MGNKQHPKMGAAIFRQHIRGEGERPRRAVFHREGLGMETKNANTKHTASPKPKWG